MGVLFHSLGWSALAAVAVPLCREQRKLRRREAQATGEVRLARARMLKANAGLQMASRAVRAMAEYVTAGLPDAPVRELLRTQLHDRAFSSHELFRVTLEQIPISRASRRSAPSQNPSTVLEMPDLLEGVRRFAGVHVKELRGRIRELRNAGIIPAEVISGSGIPFLRRREAIQLLLRYGPQRPAPAAAAAA